MTGDMYGIDFFVFASCKSLIHQITAKKKAIALYTVYNFKVFWSSRNGSFVFNQIFVYGTLMGADYKSEKKI